MPSVNKCILIGNLTRDPSTKQLPSQTLVTEFGLAMNRKFKGQNGEEREEVCFVDCAAFGRQAEVIQKYCAKGKQLYIEGRLKFDSWDDKNGGGKRSKISVVVETFQFLGSPDGERRGDGGSNQGRTGAPRGAWQGANLPSRQQPEQPFDDHSEFKEADIPF